MAEPLPPEAGRWLLTLSGGYPDGIWCCSACMAPLTEGVITHEDGCPDSAPAIRAAERERIRQLAIKRQARYRTCDGTHPNSGDCKAWAHRAPFADLIGDET